MRDFIICNEIAGADEALEVLATMHRRKARVLELRFVRGLAAEETAAGTRRRLW